MPPQAEPFGRIIIYFVRKESLQALYSTWWRYRRPAVTALVSYKVTRSQNAARLFSSAKNGAPQRCCSPKTWGSERGLHRTSEGGQNMGARDKETREGLLVASACMNNHRRDPRTSGIWLRKGEIQGCSVYWIKKKNASEFKGTPTPALAYGSYHFVRLSDINFLWRKARVLKSSWSG